MSNFRKILPVGAELFHVHGWTDIQSCQLTVDFLATQRTCLKTHLTNAMPDTPI
jgi:hypothetical protein